MLFARRWLAAATATAAPARRRPRLRDWIDQYQLAERQHRVRVTVRLAARRQAPRGAVAALGRRQSARDRARARARRELIRPTAHTQLQAGDVLFIDARAPDVEIEALRRQYAVEPLPLGRAAAISATARRRSAWSRPSSPRSSKLVGQTVLEARVRRDFGLTVIGLRRGQSVHGHGLLEEKLQIGDTLLLVGFWSDIRKLQSEGADLVVLNTPADLDEVLPAARKAPHALAVLALVVGLMVSGVIPNVQAALIGCLLMGLLGCVDLNSAYRSISWQTLVLIVGMLPLLDRAAADRRRRPRGRCPGRAWSARPRRASCSRTLFVITALLGLFISNTATAVLMAPVALAIAGDLGASPYPFAMIVALAASTAFMTPVSSPVNTLVVGPGNYAFGDFVRVGVPFTVIVLIVSVFLVPWLLPLH